MFEITKKLYDANLPDKELIASLEVNDDLIISGKISKQRYKNIKTFIKSCNKKSTDIVIKLLTEYNESKTITKMKITKHNVTHH